MLIKRPSVTLPKALYLSFLLVICTLIGNCMESAIAQIVPATASNEEVTLPSDANLGSSNPITPRGPANSTQ
jgi:hypothetical protein